MNHQLTLKNGEKITVRHLGIDQLDEVLSLQRQVIDALTRETFLQPLTTEEYHYIFTGHGLIIGAFHEDNLIAFRAMMEPELDEEHLGKDVGIPETQLHKVIYSEITTVHPSYQGNGLQLLLGKLIFNEVDVKRFSSICATVAPFNIASLKDKFALGMQIVSLKEKYGNKLRYVLFKNVEKPFVADEAMKKTVAMDDIAQQQELLKSGWFGTELLNSNGEWFVHYTK